MKKNPSPFCILISSFLVFQSCWFFGGGDITPDINSADPDARRLAIFEMGQRRSGDTTRLRKMIFEDPDEMVRGQCALTLAKIEGAKALDVIHQLVLNDKSKMAKMDGCNAIGIIGDSASVEVLSKVLSVEDDPDVRREAVKALGKINSPSSINALIDALEDNDYSVKLNARESLIKLTGVDKGLQKQNWQKKDQSN